MNFTEKNILDAVNEISEKNNLFLLDIIFRGNENNKVIEIFVDGEKYLSADDCAALSRRIYQYIDENQLISSSFRLDVSSPGIDRPLKYLKQYSKHINRKFEVSYKSGETKKRITGKLLKIEDDLLYFYSGNEQVIKFEEIVNAKVIISFS